MTSQKKFLVVAGPTASGKSGLAMELARQLNGEIVSCDSVQVYRGFDIGSAKPGVAEQSEIRHHLINVCDWRDDYDAASFAVAARIAIADIQQRGKVAIVAGGTGLYLRALLQQGFHADLPSDEGLRSALKLEKPADLYLRLVSMDPKRAAELHPNDTYRIIRALELNILLGGTLGEKMPALDSETAKDAFIIILNPLRHLLHECIALRTEQMLSAGLEQEVENLLAIGVDPHCKPMQSIGYKEVASHLAGTLAKHALAERIIAATRQYAKRQCTWFRKTIADFQLAEPRLSSDQHAKIISSIS